MKTLNVEIRIYCGREIHDAEVHAAMAKILTIKALQKEPELHLIVVISRA